MIDKQKQKLNMKVQWTKFAIVLVLYLAFLLWVQSWLGLVVVPFIYDVYITKKIRWQWWKDSEGPVRFIMSWVDALVFALVAVYFINLFFFQNYVIPSSSLGKSLHMLRLPERKRAFACRDHAARIIRHQCPAFICNQRPDRALCRTVPGQVLRLYQRDRS